MQRFLLPLVLVSLVFSACSSQGGVESFEEVSFGSMAMQRDMGAKMMDFDESIPVDDSGYVEGVEQKLIKTGSLGLHMEDVRVAVENIKSLMQGMNGDVSYSNVSRSGNAYYGNLTVRVPSDQFDVAMAALKDLSVYVEYETTNAENVTEVYMDLEAHLTALQAEEQQYLQILNQATTVEEILQVTDYLSNVRYEIESVQGQLKYYDSNIDYSTITLTLTEDENIAAVGETWRPLGTLRDALSDWLGFLQGAVDGLIYVVIFAWPLLVIAIVLWPFLRRRKSRK